MFIAETFTAAKTSLFASFLVVITQLLRLARTPFDFKKRRSQHFILCTFFIEVLFLLQSLHTKLRHALRCFPSLIQQVSLLRNAFSQMVPRGL